MKVWRNIDWAKPTGEIATLVGCSEGAVRYQRRKRKAMLADLVVNRRVDLQRQAVICALLDSGLDEAEKLIRRFSTIPV